MLNIYCPNQHVIIIDQSDIVQAARTHPQGRPLVSPPDPRTACPPTASVTSPSCHANKT